MLNTMGKNAVQKGELIFQQGDPVTQVAIVLSGKVLMQNEWMQLVRSQGSFLAINDMDKEGYDASYTTLEDSVIYILPCKGQESLKEIISKNADFRAIMISSQFRYITELARIRNDLADRGNRIYHFAKKSYEKYKQICEQAELHVIALDELEKLENYEMLQDYHEDRLPYYAEAAKIPLAANKQYFSYSEEMVSFQVLEISSLVESFTEDCYQMMAYIKDVLSVIGLKQSHNLFEYCCVQGQEMRRKGQVPIEMKELLDDIFSEGEYQYNELKKQMHTMVELNAAEFRKKIDSVISKEMTESEREEQEEKDARIKRDVLSLKNSIDQVIKFGELSDEDANVLKTNVDYLVKAPDRLSVEDDVKKAKKAITPLVFKLYLNCYRNYGKTVANLPKAVELFMNFGMLDERLLDEEQLVFLCGIGKEINEGPCQVFTMVEWLDEIKERRRDPSKSEFDEDYIENLRTLKKQGDITDKELKELTDDIEKRVEYEVMNMQMANTKALYGQPTAYMPILYKEAIFGYLDKILVTKKKVNESIAQFAKLDYSVFYREVIYSNTDYKITNETTMQEVYPDVILFPIFGINASMWQEVGGKNKATPGRFCFPILCSTNIDDLTVKLLGRFRWELCRCIQGMSWNDVKVKSLTSEYMDYIQFYRKNRELTEEAREKFKLQIQKGRNNSREIFLQDYEVWIKNEANGSLKMNKVARELLATYCPFEKTLRDKLVAQRPYEVAMARGMRNALKKTQEFELKIKAIQKEKPDVPEEIMNTYKFYAEM